MFGDPIKNEKRWPQLTLDSVCDGIGDGLHGTPEYDDLGAFYFINGNNLINGTIVITPSTKKVNETTYKKYFTNISSNALLLSINGTLGKIAFYNDEAITLGKSACYINLKSFVNRYFVFELMRTDPFLKYLEENSTKSTIKNVSLKTIRNFKLISPPEILQNDFIAFSKQIDKSKFLLQKILEKLELLKKSRFIELFGSTDLSLQKDDWVEIKNIGEVVSGSTPQTTNESYWGGENKWITPAELSSDTYVITKTDRYLTDEGVKSCSLRKLPKDTVLLTSRAPIGKVAIAGTEMYCNQGFKNIICNEKVRPKYLFYLLKNNVRYLEYLGRGATFKEISKRIVENVKIPLFPIQEQDRFIEFAEQIDKSKLVIQKSLEDLVGKS